MDVKPRNDSTLRFSERVEHYVCSRPGYPPGVLTLLAEHTGLTATSTVADVGSGTGISSELFLRHGNTVFGIEPNAAMRAVAERLLADCRNFHSIDGTAEATTLAEASVDLVAAGQAFHWFDRDRAGREFARILRPGGFVVLLWNTRRTESTPLGRGYEELIREFGTDYGTVRHENIATEKLADFFAAGSYRRFEIENRQQLDLAGFQSRLSSSSYLPNVGHPRYAAMMTAAERLFAACASNGRVIVEYDTEIHLGRPRAC